jgi:hypothetical protein
MQNEAKTCEKCMLFVLQKEAKIMRNGLRFASISHGAKKNVAKKGHPTVVNCLINTNSNIILRFVFLITNTKQNKNLKNFFLSTCKSIQNRIFMLNAQFLKIRLFMIFKFVSY